MENDERITDKDIKTVFGIVLGFLLVGLFSKSIVMIMCGLLMFGVDVMGIIIIMKNPEWGDEDDKEREIEENKEIEEYGKGSEAKEIHTEECLGSHRRGIEERVI